MTLVLLLISAAIFVAIRVYPYWWSSVRRILVLDLTFFAKLRSWWQRKALPNTECINKGCILISSSNYFSLYKWGNMPLKRIGVAQNTLEDNDRERFVSFTWQPAVVSCDRCSEFLRPPCDNHGLSVNLDETIPRGLLVFMSTPSTTRMKFIVYGRSRIQS